LSAEELSFIGTCGFYCGSCAIFLAAQKGKDHQRNVAAALSKHLDRTVRIAEVQCQGCQNLGKDCWGKGCTIKSCAVSKGVKFCNECALFPCENLCACAEIYQDIPLIQLQELNEGGPEKWMEKIKERWTCPNCGGRVEAGTMRCWSCNFNCRKKVEDSLKSS
jgi:hypothetical protein